MRDGRPARTDRRRPTARAGTGARRPTRAQAARGGTAARAVGSGRQRRRSGGWAGVSARLHSSRSDAGSGARTASDRARREEHFATGAAMTAAMTAAARMPSRVCLPWAGVRGGPRHGAGGGGRLQGGGGPGTRAGNVTEARASARLSHGTCVRASSCARNELTEHQPVAHVAARGRDDAATLRAEARRLRAAAARRHRPREG